MVLEFVGNTLELVQTCSINARQTRHMAKILQGQYMEGRLEEVPAH